MTFTLPTPEDFNFWSTVYSHGWCALPPFNINKERKRLALVTPGVNGKYHLVEVHSNGSSLIADLREGTELSSEAKTEISGSLRAMFRLDESFDEFHREARKHSDFRWVARRGAGRLLRSATVFEDVVKMICTTNCSWALTETMVKALTTKLGTRVSEGVYAFPVPEAIAAKTEAFLRKEIRCGYRAPYILELSQNISRGKISIEQWRSSTMSTEELFLEVCKVKGVGDYAAGNILKLLGRYDYLGLDSWCRGKFYAMHKNGRKVKDATIEKHYAQYGKWRGLFLWMDVTKDWYDREFPF